ncbi:hypothetical protein [Donghicola eburneus]|uniref:Putative secreted protein n=1 Tax=Donghicola eburneus TaxID=393278 RepID=A0A1M4N376_9RHOB|nr:hypothetical protein [Donghicola eburneus]SCM68468.1 putative secreted protein [Donghicola eburneus]SFQ25042.1 hypothetical protein SAMN05421764_102287 [Donghicola eburneus]
MKRTALIIASALAATFAAPTAFAAGNGNCPPGLVKKNPPCVPPGQAKKGHDGGHFQRGDHIDHYDRLDQPNRYGLNDGNYVVSNGYVYRINEQTGEVLALIGAMQNLLN